MNYWIVPSNNRYYRLDDRLSKYETISWRQRQNFEVGDVIFIYTTRPSSRITYQMSVIGANQSFSKYNNDKEYWVNQEEYAKKVINFKRFAEFKLVRRFPSDERLTYDNLKARGLNTIQMSHRINGALLDYILSSISDIDAGNMFPEEIGEEETLFEGATSKVLVNRYERNSEARKKCIEQKGCCCTVCGMSFEVKYGEIGKEFIHIHHTTPISTIGKDYQIDYEKDLVPVCPNCHAMLHRKNPPYTIEELKQIINKLRN